MYPWGVQTMIRVSLSIFHSGRLIPDIFGRISNLKIPKGAYMRPDETNPPGEGADTPSSQPAAGTGAARRAPDGPEDRTLNAAAQVWYAALPKTVQPALLAERYPGICNRMSERWQHPDLVIPYFDDLLMDNRGGRQGFPISIAIEIASLKEYFLDALAAHKLDVWDRNVGRP
jgi:hypothetical protein